MNVQESPPAPSPAIWVDVEDLFHYVRFNPRPSGIQRVAFAIQQSLHACLAASGRLHFVRHAGRETGHPLTEIPWTAVESVFSRFADPDVEKSAMHGESHPSAPARREPWLLAVRHQLGRIAYRMAPELRDPLLQAWFSQKDAARELAALLRAKRLQSPPDSSPILPQQNLHIQRGDIFLVLGSPWVHADFGDLLRALKEDYGMQVALLLYDLIPAVHPEWCTRDLVEEFQAWLRATLPQCDILFAISRYSAQEVERWVSREGIRLSMPVRSVPMGTGFEVTADSHPSGLPRAGSYVLFVSTIEARKNHALLVRVWKELLEEERLGLRSCGSVPDLVFAGRVGWLVSDLLQQLENASWFDGRVRLIRDPSDAELRALYEGCLFSVFPSWHEGWGLPVTEALGLGVPVLCSSATALTESGGDLARYFDPGNTDECRKAIAALLDDRGELAAWRAEVRTRFQPTPWSLTARAILNALPGSRSDALVDAT